MKAAETRGRHLTPDEIVDRVFPSVEGPAPVPMHLAVCAECQGKVAQLREAWLLDRGAVDGVVDSYPETYWHAQASSVMDSVRREAGSAGAAGVVRPFPFSMQRSFFRRHVLAIGSLAAALALVAGIGVFRARVSPTTTAQNGPVATPVAASLSQEDEKDDELLLSIEDVLSEDAPLAHLVPDAVS